MTRLVFRFLHSVGAGILDIKGDNVEPPPSMGGSVDTSFILGMGKVGDAVKILLDIDKVMTADELTDVVHTAEVAEASPESAPAASAEG